MLAMKMMTMITENEEQDCDDEGEMVMMVTKKEDDEGRISEDLPPLRLLSGHAGHVVPTTQMIYCYFKYIQTNIFRYTRDKLLLLLYRQIFS